MVKYMYDKDSVSSLHSQVKNTILLTLALVERLFILMFTYFIFLLPVMFWWLALPGITRDRAFGGQRSKI